MKEKKVSQYITYEFMEMYNNFRIISKVKISSEKDFVRINSEGRLMQEIWNMGFMMDNKLLAESDFFYIDKSTGEEIPLSELIYN